MYYYAEANITQISLWCSQSYNCKMQFGGISGHEVLAHFRCILQRKLIQSYCEQ